MDNGKTNAYGRIDYGGCMRAKNASECPHNALAFSLFQRFHIDNEPFPTFQRRENWYHFHLLVHEERTVAMQYNNHYHIMKRILGSLDIHTSKKTHLNRGGAARHAEDSGASEGEIRRAGRWNVQQMQGCYLTGLPRKAMRALAGFPTKPGAYHLPRATINPPPALLNKIWPDVEGALLGIEQGRLEKDLAAQGFLRLLVYLRTVLVQDAVVMRKQFPQHPIFQHTIFADPLFIDYAKNLEVALDKNERPLSVSVQEILPEVHRYLLDMQRDQQAAHLVTQHTNSTILQLAGLVQGAFTSILNEVDSLANREVKVTVHIEQHQQRTGSSPVAVAALAQSVGE
ncbi:unnamed protein product, partial [Tilletia caries]